MSQYASPFLVLNLGSEMIFVVAQRLQAQNISEERSTLVLEDLIAGLTSKSLMSDLMKPQDSLTHEKVREIIENIAQSSAMRLDSISMGKLWDLITMIFKWQVTMSTEVIEITQRHLYEIESYVASEETQLQLHRVQNIVDNFNKVLSREEKALLHEEVQYWNEGFNVRVSLLLRMGLQDMEGNFVVNNLDPIAEKMLQNLGQNVYHVTQNGRILEKRSNIRHDQTSVNNTTDQNVNELKCFVEEMLGERKLSSGSMEGNSNVLRLALNDENLNNNLNDRIRFDSIDVNVNEQEKLQNLMKDLNVNEEDRESTSLKDDLLDMIGNDDNQSIV